MTFEFINDDTKTQIAVSRSIIDVADRLRERLFNITDEADKSALINEIRQLLNIANEFSQNAIRTTTIGSYVLQNVVAIYRR